jgi:hypothetical protein
MTGKRAAIFGLLLLLPPLAAAPLSSYPAVQGFALGMRSGWAVALTQSPLFPMKAQAAWEGGVLAELPLFGFLAVGISLDYRYTAPSDLAGGFLYRGHGGICPGLYLSIKAPLIRAPKRMGLLGGLATGGSASFDRYSLTELYFFYPSVFLEPFLAFYFPRLGPNTFCLSAPLRLDFRRDLDRSLAIGLALGWRYYPAGRKVQG